MYQQKFSPLKLISDATKASQNNIAPVFIASMGLSLILISILYAFLFVVPWSDTTFYLSILFISIVYIIGLDIVSNIIAKMYITKQKININKLLILAQAAYKQITLAGLVVYTLIMVGSLLFFIPGLIIYYVTYFAIPIAAVHKTNPILAVKKSTDFVIKYPLYVASLFFLIGFLQNLVSLPASYLLDFLQFNPLIDGALIGLCTFVLFPFFVVKYLAYFHLSHVDKLTKT